MKQGTQKLRLTVWLCGLSLMVAAVAGSSAQAEALFTYKGKTYATADLPQSLIQGQYDIESERYEKMKRLVDSAVLSAYIDEEVKKSGKTKAQVEESFTKVKDASEKEMKDWFDKNKERIPYPYDQIKGEIKKLLASEQVNEKRTKLLEDLKKKGNFTLALKEPVAPVVTIVSDGFPTKGAAGAKVAIVEFADYQCPHCREASNALKKVVEKYKDKVKFTYMDYPINPSGISLVVAHGAVCADEQGKFWEFHDVAFEKQGSLTKESPAALAKDLKLDEGAFGKCMAGPKNVEKVAKSKAEGERLGIQGTPTVYINGRRITTGYTEAELSRLIDQALKGAAS